MFLCPTCGGKLKVDKSFDWLYACISCKMEHDLHDTVIKPQKSMAHLLNDPRQALWWHATTQPNWLREVKDAGVWVHVGAWRASKMIMRQRRQGAYDLYKLRIVGGTVGDVVNDNNNFPYMLHDDLTMTSDTLYPYINRYESPGSVSLLINPEHLEIIEKRRVCPTTKARGNMKKSPS